MTTVDVTAEFRSLSLNSPEFGVRNLLASVVAVSETVGIHNRFHTARDNEPVVGVASC